MNHENLAYASAVRWGDDQTIMAFELGNELRCRECNGDASIVTNWADEMSTGAINEGLPVLTVDEETYRMPPAFVTATSTRVSAQGGVRQAWIWSRALSIG